MTPIRFLLAVLACVAFLGGSTVHAQTYTCVKSIDEIEVAMPLSKAKQRDQTIRRLWALCYAGDAFSQVREIAEYYLEMGYNAKHKLHVAFSTAAATLYAQPFSGAKRMPSLQKEYWTFDDARHTKTHKLLCDARHGYYAHKDPTLVRALVFSTKRLKDGDLKWGITTNAHHIHSDVFHHIPDLCELQMSKIDADKRRLLAQLYTADELLKELHASPKKQLMKKIPWPKA